MALAHALTKGQHKPQESFSFGSVTAFANSAKAMVSVMAESMASSDLRALLSKTFEDPDLEAKLRAQGSDPVAVAAAAGYNITAEEFSNAQKSWDNWRMSALHDEEF